MARPTVPSQQKLAEKLLILNDRGLGMLTRIYNIKKVNTLKFWVLFSFLFTSQYQSVTVVKYFYCLWNL